MSQAIKIDGLIFADEIEKRSISIPIADDVLLPQFRGQMSMTLSYAFLKTITGIIDNRDARKEIERRAALDFSDIKRQFETPTASIVEATDASADISALPPDVKRRFDANGHR
jgi:hypothetical protein